jgi:biopolymer transport protein ExbD/biopolymer transport protein TolR
MAFGNNKQGKIFSEINITPLTDIFLVLLIIMMVVAPSFQSNDTAVDVPEINNGVNIEEAKVTVSVTHDGAMYVNGEPVSASELTDKLVALKTDEEKQEVIVKADKNIKSAKIMDIMDCAQNAEYQKLIVAGEPLNKKEQKELESNASRRSIEIPTEEE